MYRILITGGKGYIGRNLNRLLTDRGHEIHAPSHSELDLLNYDKLEEYIRCNRFNAVIHTATKGGRRMGDDTFENTYIPNILMYDNLTSCVHGSIPIITFGSGAEFDRRHRIDEEYASSIFFNWPIDPYGLSKNIITRRATTYTTNVWVLRLFGCFNYDEDDTRFIKSCINNVKNNTPITIHKNIYMDFFFLDDIVPVINHILNKNFDPDWSKNMELVEPMKLERNLNLTYYKKENLLDIAKLVTSIMGKPDHKIIIEQEYGDNKNYTGSGKVLLDLGIPLCGLYEGIRRTVHKLK